MKKNCKDETNRETLIRKLTKRILRSFIPVSTPCAPDGLSLKEKIASHITEIISTLQGAGYEAYIVGGAVRDLLLGRTPKDYDISTSATPEQVKAVFRRQYVLIIGNRFKLVHYHYGNEIIEISTFRKKPTASLQEKPGIPKMKTAPANMIFSDNEFGTPEEDAMRRDFTVNALFYDPTADKILDYTNLGLKDLKEGVVRAIGEAEVRFEEDPVRMLRALKLVGQYDFRLEEKTGRALESKKSLIRLASDSRLTLETEKILKNPYGDRILETFHRHGFLDFVLPGLARIWEKPEGKTIRKLWDFRNQRIRKGEYRESISIAMAILAYPAWEKLRSGKERPIGEIRGILENTITDLLKPRYPTHRVVGASLRSLVLLPLFQDRSEGNLHRFPMNPGYPHARELAVSIHGAFDGKGDFESVWPKREKKGSSQGRPPRRKRPRRNRNHEPGTPAAGDPGHAAQ